MDTDSPIAPMETRATLSFFGGARKRISAELTLPTVIPTLKELSARKVRSVSDRIIEQYLINFRECLHMSYSLPMELLSYIQNVKYCSLCRSVMLLPLAEQIYLIHKCGHGSSFDRNIAHICLPFEFLFKINSWLPANLPCFFQLCSFNCVLKLSNYLVGLACTDIQQNEID